jgi:hypothetical protein
MTVFRASRITALAALIGLMAAPSAFAQKKDDKKSQQQDQNKLTDAQKTELTPLIKTIDEVMKGGSTGSYTTLMGKDNTATVTPAAAAAESPFTWHNDFLRASNQLIYVPYIVTIEAGKITPSVVGYLRVTPKGLNAPVEAKKDSKTNPYPFEDIYFTDLKTTTGGPMKLTRAFAVPAGSYDVYLAFRDRGGNGSTADKEKEKAGVPVMVLKQELTVPDYWNGELTTSTIMVADKVEALTAPVPPEAQRERPYVLGTAEIVPAVDNKFKKAEELGIIFQIYGAQVGPDKKPDVTIDYVFYQKDASGGEKMFNKTVPTTLNAQSLPPTFDPDQGHQLVGGQQIPLSSFPEGDYRMEIKITDNKSSKSITREVPFSVTP